jgi:hypothetical protein
VGIACDDGLVGFSLWFDVFGVLVSLRSYEGDGKTG